MAKRLVVLTLDHEILGLNPAEGGVSSRDVKHLAENSHEISSHIFSENMKKEICYSLDWCPFMLKVHITPYQLLASIPDA